VKDRNGDQTANLMTKDEAGALRNIAKLPELLRAGVSGWPTLPRRNVKLR